MSVISIREREGTEAGAVVSIDGQEYPITVTDPFAEKGENRLEWYFEKLLLFPFVEQVKAREAAASITSYGETLFNQVFADRRAYGRYKAALQQGIETLSFEVVGSSDFHHLHWEALKDPELPQPLALQTPFIRRNFQPQTILAQLRSSPTINLLVVSARPGGQHDVGYRTISRPLVNVLRQAKLRVQIDILRPGTYEALERHLEETQRREGTGFYHVIHFDVHGALLPYAKFQAVEPAQPTGTLLFQQRYGRPDIAPYEGLKAFLFLESGDEGKNDPVEATELAKLLLYHQVSIAILNACQSGKQIGERETSLGSQLMQAGTQTVMAMGYSVSVTAAERLMQRLYQQIFAGFDLAAAIQAARLELFNRKDRLGAYHQEVDLEDWLLPVVYQNQPQQIKLREFTPEEEKIFYERQAVRYPEPKVSYAFVGRDLDILHIERLLLSYNNLLLVRGMGGSGKTTLLHHLGYWWQTTGLVEQVFYFGYDQKAWTRQQIMNTLARQIMDKEEYRTRFQPRSPQGQQEVLAELLRSHRHLIMLDNLESITGTPLAIQNTLSSAEQAKLHNFLASLTEGKTLVLLGSRGSEEWLAAGTFVDNVYELQGLDPEAASGLADLILHRHKATRYWADTDLEKLLKLLEGYPLPMEIVLANLARQTPGDVLAALENGLKEIDTTKKSKTESLLACIDYSYGNLSPNAQQLLLCMAPFTGVIYVEGMAQYVNQLKQQAALAQLPFDQWQQVLTEAQNWGLLTAHQEAQGFLRIQPILPYFLRNRLNTQPEMLSAVETAFRQYYDMGSGKLYELMNSKAPEEKQVGTFRVHLEYENILAALGLALQAQVSILTPYIALSAYLDTTQEQSLGLSLGEQVLNALEKSPPESLRNRLDLVTVVDSIAKRQLLTKQYTAAEQSYLRVLNLVANNTALQPAQQGKLKASGLHELGLVAQEQRQWAQAELYYQQSLDINIEFNDRSGQANTYHNLGMVAQEQRKWEQADHYYQQSLDIKIEFNNRYEKAVTYHQLGLLAVEQRQWEQAEHYYQQSLDIKIEFNDRPSLASTYHELGRVAEEQRLWEKAEQYYQQALAIYIEFNDPCGQALTYHHFGRVAQEQSQWDQAEQYYKKAIDIKIENKDRYNQASTYHQLGRVAQEQCQWMQADRYYQQALAIFIECNDRCSQAGTYHQLGRVVEEQCQWMQADRYYQQALAIFIECNDRYRQVNVYYNLASVSQNQRQWPQALEYLLQALAISLEFADKDRTLVVLHTLARLRQEIGDASLPADVATILNTTAEEVMVRFSQLVDGNK